MCPSEPNAQFAAEVDRIKRTAIERDARVRRALGPLAIAGVLVGIAVWFLADPRNRDEIHASAAIGLGLAAFVVGCLLCRMLFPIPAAKCPQCGCDWNLESEHDLQKWLAWSHCPGCGLKLSADEDLSEKA